MTGHRRIPSKIKPRSPRASAEPTIEQYLIIKKKNPIVLPSRWPDDTDIETIQVFLNSHLGGTNQKSCSF